MTTIEATLSSAGSRNGYGYQSAIGPRTSVYTSHTAGNTSHPAAAATVGDSGGGSTTQSITTTSGAITCTTVSTHFSVTDTSAAAGASSTAYTRPVTAMYSVAAPRRLLKERSAHNDGRTASAASTATALRLLSTVK